MVIVATILVLALIGFFVSIGLIIANLLPFTGTAKRTIRIVSRPIQTVTQTIHLANGIYQKSAIQAGVIGKHGVRAWTAVSAAYHDISAAAQTIDVESWTKNGSAAREIFQDIQKTIKLVNELRRAMAKD